MLEILGPFAFLLFSGRETKLKNYQWQAAAKTAQNFDLHLIQNHGLKYVYFNLNIIYQGVLKQLAL